MSDIVERLRDPTSRWVAFSEPDPLRLEAADKIERLKAALREITVEQSALTAQEAADRFQRIARDALEGK